MLAPVRHNDGEFTDRLVLVDGVAGDALLHRPAILFGKSDQRHLLIVVDLGKASQHGRRQFAQRIHEAELLGLCGQVLHKAAFAFRVFGADRPYDQRRAVVELVRFTRCRG